MAEIIYSLCAITSGLCAWLLAAAYRTTKSRLLLWSSIAFAGLALNNMALWIDKLILPHVDLSIVRTLIALIAMLILLYGLIWEAE
jgi:hydrogenase/urease accessory protein HupE